MSKKPVYRRADTLSLRGLDPAPAQTWGAIRLVPLIRRDVREDLRLARRGYGEDAAVVRLDGRPGGAGHAYASFVPHALVVSWSEDGSPVASFGASLSTAGPGTKAATGTKAPSDGVPFGRHVRLLHRMARREDTRRLRLLPMHLAMEGFLALHFGMPEIAWPEYSRRALRRGLDPRVESSISGWGIVALQEALRVFEIHEGQTGVLVFVADALASAFVVPHPDDYRALHASLTEDFFGELLYRYGMLHPDLPPARATIDDTRVHSLADLRAAVTGMRRDWSEFATLLASGAEGREITVEPVHRLAPFSLERFVTPLRLHEENHIGERILRADGTLEYLATYRLSDAQSRRAHLLTALAAHEWHLDSTAAALASTREELVRRLENAGFGYILSRAVRAAAGLRDD